MIDTLYTILVGSLFVGAIVFVWIIIVALVLAAIQQMRKRK